MTMILRRMAVLSAIFSLMLPVTANAWKVGERGDAGSIFLHVEPIEGVYVNNWWGTAVGSADDGDVKVYISGEGKTVDFDGILSLNCESADGHFWKTASNFETPVKQNEMGEILPKKVLQNARKFFCKKN